MYLVKSRFSNCYTSVNTIDYYNRLKQCDTLPWYYQYYDYKLHNAIIPCNLNYQPLPRSSLNINDRDLYRLHLQAVKLAKSNNKFYWQFDNTLTEKFSALWERIVNDPLD